jgi:hypothetical protein
MTLPFMAGIAIKLSRMTGKDQERMQEAGLNWLRSEIDNLDQEQFFRGDKQPEQYYSLQKKIRGLREAGFQIMGITPNPRNMIPDAGPPGSQKYFDNYRRLCSFLGHEFKGLIDYWQVGNELDIPIFRDTLSLEESVLFLKAGLRGLKEAGQKLQVGVNITLFPSKPGEVDGNTDLHEGVFIAKSIYHDPAVEIDYAGFDSYPGTWREGGAESWNEYLDTFHELVRKPIIIQEFGYASAGEMMTAKESRDGASPCEARKWRFAWKGAHTPEIQADFIAETYRILAKKPFVIGATYYCWKDHETCWQCGNPDCPAETAWGLVDRGNNLKPSYHSLKSSLHTYLGAMSSKKADTVSSADSQAD